MNQLPIFVTLKGRKVILLGEGEMADAKRRLYERTGAEIVDDETAANIALAVVAIENESEALAAVKRLKTRGLLVNAVDRPELCDFTTPAIIDRDPVLIAIGTGGNSAGLAKALRQRLEHMLPASLGSLAKALHEVRSSIRKIWPDSADRRKAIDAALDIGAVLDPVIVGSADNVQKWLDDPTTTTVNRVVNLVLTSDDPDELTIQQARLLGQADCLYTAGDVPRAILNRARADAQHRPIDTFSDVNITGLNLRIRMAI